MRVCSLTLPYYGQLVKLKYEKMPFCSKILLEESGDAYELYSFMDKDRLFYII